MLWEFLLLGALPLYIFRKLKKLKNEKRSHILQWIFMLPPEIVQLLENNKGGIITPSSDAIVDIQRLTKF